MDDHDAVARWRAQVHAQWLDGDPPAEACGHREASIGGIRCLIADGPTDLAAPTMVYFHGGGFALGSPEVALPITDRLRETSAVRSVDYRLAPEHPFPAAREDALRVIAATAAERPARPIVLAGDSAGGALALSVALELTTPDEESTRGLQAGSADVAGLVLFSPQLDWAPAPRTDPTSDVNDEVAAWLRAAYCGGRPPNDPAVAPGWADPTGLPPTLIQVGAIEGSLRAAIRFARRARMAGVDVTLDVWDGLWHAWHYHRDLPEADRALAEAGDFATRIARRATSGP